VHRVIGLGHPAAQARQLHVEGLAPVAQAGTGFQTETSAQVLILAAVEVELIAQHQAVAATFRLIVKRWTQIALGVSVAIDSSEFCRL
jgi:hypothetical protein